MEPTCSQTDLLIDQTRMLVQRLERISADSIWARRASGLRGSLLRRIEQHETRLSGDQPPVTDSPVELAQLQALVNAGFLMLERAAAERLR